MEVNETVSSLSLMIALVFIAWGIYRRVKRTVGIQLYTPKRFIFRIFLFSLLGIALLLFAFQHPISYVYILAGMLAGLILVYYSSKTTLFETKEGLQYYKPNTAIGLIVVFLFLGRLAFRIYASYTQFESIHTGAANGGVQSPSSAANGLNGGFPHDPITMATFFVLITYYVGYYLYLMKAFKTREVSVQ